MTDQNQKEKRLILSGKKPSLWLFDNRYLLEVPDGFVCDGYLEKEISDAIKAEAYPMKIGRFERFADKVKGHITQKRAEKVLGTNQVLLLLLRDDKEKSGWACEFVSIQDLFEKPELLSEQMIDAKTNGNEDLVSCKRQAYLAITGEVDM